MIDCVVSDHLFCPYQTKLGSDEITVHFADPYVIPKDFRMTFGITTGYARDFEFSLLQKDCDKTISNSPFDIDIFRFRYNFTDYGYYIQISSDNELLTNNAVYNQKSGLVQVCAEVRVDSNIKFHEVFEIQYNAAGAFVFMSSWTGGNTITANYLVSRDDFNGDLLQKDCVTPIEDTSVTEIIDNWIWDEEYNFTSFMYTLDPGTARSSVIFNADISSNRGLPCSLDRKEY